MKKLILDLDTGVDDALAIAYALGSPELELIAITGTYGNVVLPLGVKNSLQITELLGHPETKVYPGIPHAEAADGFETLEISKFIHGQNGIGDIELPEPTREAESTPAVDFIIEAAQKYGDDLVYVPTGPLTNLAAAIRKHPDLVKELKNVVLMGGALTTRGNASPSAEANISQDPEAADFVFRSGIHTTMIGLDVTLKTLLTYKETQLWRETGTEAGKQLADMTDYYIRAYETTAPDLGGCGLHDPLAVAVAIDPSLVTTFPINLQVDTEEGTRGRTIGDHARLNDVEKTTLVAIDVDVPRFLEEFMTRVGRAIANAK